MNFAVFINIYFILLRLIKFKINIKKVKGSQT